MERTFGRMIRWEMLAAKNPRRTPPRVASGPILLTGLAAYAACGGGGMTTLRTGKGGRYRYYACATCAHRGKAPCPGRSVPMGAPDRLVLDAFAEKVLTPARLEQILAAYVALSAAEAEAGRKERLARLRAEATEARAGVQRLLALVEAGEHEPDDPELRERLAAAKARRRAEQEIAPLEGQAGSAAGPRAITPAKVAKLGEAIRRALEAGDPAFRRAYLRLFVSRVVVADEEIRITGPTAALAAAAASDAPEMPAGSVPSFVPEWRPVCDETENWCVLVPR